MIKFKIGDKVRVKTVEEMMDMDNVETKVDRFGTYLEFYDENGNEEFLQFPITGEYVELTNEIFTIKDILNDGAEIDLLEDENIGYAVSKHMIELYVKRDV